MRFFRRAVLWLAASVLICASACSGKKDKAQQPDKKQKPQVGKADGQQEPTTKAKPRPKADIKVAVASWSDVEKRIATSHQGKVVVVDLWATW